jgi:hypothetical protein
MPTIIIGVVALLIVLWALNAFKNANPKGLAIGMRTAGGIAAVAGAAFLALRGQLAIAIPLGATGLGLLGWGPFTAAGWGQRTSKSDGQVSRVRSAFVEMELDHDSGRMTGHILSGRYQGVALDTLDVPTLVAVLREFDEDSRALLGAYLDRRDASWREHADGGAAAGEFAAAASGKMTEQEAYQILGLAPGASASDISRAHRTLMKKLHPDQGGSTYLAARVNQAKDVLLSRHR